MSSSAVFLKKGGSESPIITCLLFFSIFVIKAKTASEKAVVSAMLANWDNLRTYLVGDNNLKKEFINKMSSFYQSIIFL
jgi:hypothetical protein